MNLPVPEDVPSVPGGLPHAHSRVWELVHRALCFFALMAILIGAAVAGLLCLAAFAWAMQVYEGAVPLGVRMWGMVGVLFLALFLNWMGVRLPVQKRKTLRAI